MEIAGRTRREASCSFTSAGEPDGGERVLGVVQGEADLGFQSVIEVLPADTWRGFRVRRVPIH